MRLVLLHSTTVDKVIICVERKKTFHITKGTREGLCNLSRHLGSILKLANPEHILIDFVGWVREILVKNIDYNVVFDFEAEDMGKLHDAVVNWANHGALPMNPDEEGWWDGNIKENIWENIDRGI